MNPTESTRPDCQISQTLPAEHSVFRSASIVSAAVFASRVTGLVREMIMAALFGAAQAYDAFLLGFRIPNLTRDLFAEGALSSAFVPVFSEYLTQRGRQAAAALANLVATAIILIVGGICCLGILLAPALVHLLAPGFHEVPGKFELAVRLTRIMFPFLLLVALAAQAMGILNACNQFGVPALASTFFNIGSVIFGLILGFVLGPQLGISAIEGMAWGVVAGGALQLLWQLPSLWREGFIFRPRLSGSDPGLRRILLLMGPAILGNAAVQINVMVNTNFASQIEDPIRGHNGPVSWLAYAFRFMQLPLGLFGVAIASATLPAISRNVAMQDLGAFRRTLARSLSMVFLLTIPSSVGLMILGDSIVGAIYEFHRFDAYDTRQTAIALSCYAVGLAGYAGIKVLNPAFYALGDSRTPMLISLSSVAINFCAVVLLLRYTRLGHAGLALANSAVALAGGVLLFAIMRARLQGLYGRAIWSSLLRTVLASLAMGGAIWASSESLQHWVGTSKPARLLDLAISIPLGLTVFYCSARLLKLQEIQDVQTAVLRPFSGWLLSLHAKMRKQ